MRYYAVNGSPRKTHNTGILLDYALTGIQDACPEAETERINIYDYLYKGCISCCECKKIGGKSYGICRIQDAVTPLLMKLYDADGIIFGSPIYFHDITGQLRCFLERFLFPCLEYGKEYRSLAKKKMQLGFIYTMNATQENMENMDYPNRLSRMEQFMETVFTAPRILYSTDTYQFDNYSLYMCERFSEEKKAAHREKYFPTDCREAFLMGQQITGEMN